MSSQTFAQQDTPESPDRPQVEQDDSTPDLGDNSQKPGNILTDGPNANDSKGAVKWGQGKGLDTSQLLHQMLVLVLVILVLGGIAWYVFKKFLPRMRYGSSGRKIRIVETSYINPRQSVHLVEVGTRKLLLAGSKEGLQLLRDVTDAFDADGSRDFAEVLAEQDRTESPEGEK
jgi:flagellar biogenesis protein FliO